MIATICGIYPQKADVRHEDRYLSRPQKFPVKSMIMVKSSNLPTIIRQLMNLSLIHI